VRAAAGLPATMVVALGPPTTALALPATAVVGTAQQGQVVIVDPAHSSTHVASVKLGATDGTWTQITGGLTTQDRVLAAPIQSDLAGQ